MADDVEHAEPPEMYVIPAARILESGGYLAGIGATGAYVPAWLAEQLVLEGVAELGVPPEPEPEPQPEPVP